MEFCFEFTYCSNIQLITVDSSREGLCLSTSWALFFFFDIDIQRCGALCAFLSKQYDAEYCKNNFIKAVTSVDADFQWSIEIAGNFNCNLWNS